MATTYEERTKAELLEIAAEKNIEGRASMNKADLIAALRGEAPADGDTAQETSTDEQKAEAAAGGRADRDRIDKEPAKESNDAGFESPTPSARAAEKAGDAYVSEGDPGDPDGDHWQPEDQEAVLAQGEKYAKEKAKHRWG